MVSLSRQRKKRGRGALECPTQSVKMTNHRERRLSTSPTHPWHNWIAHRSSEPRVAGSNPAGCAAANTVFYRVDRFRVIHPILYERLGDGFRVLRSVAVGFRVEMAVAANWFSVKKYLAAAEFRSLNRDQIPVNCAAIAVIGFLVGLTGRQVKRPADLFIEQDVLHRVSNRIVAPKRPLADVASPTVGIQYLVEIRVVSITGRMDDLAILEGESDSAEQASLIPRSRIVCDHSIDAKSEMEKTLHSIRQFGQ